MEWIVTDQCSHRNENESSYNYGLLFLAQWIRGKDLSRNAQSVQSIAQQTEITAI